MKNNDNKADGKKKRIFFDRGRRRIRPQWMSREKWEEFKKETEVIVNGKK